MKERRELALPAGVSPGDGVSADFFVRKRQLRPGKASRKATSIAGSRSSGEGIAAAPFVAPVCAWRFNP